MLSRLPLIWKNAGLTLQCYHFWSLAYVCIQFALLKPRVNSIDIFRGTKAKTIHRHTIVALCTRIYSTSTRRVSQS
jgi:hypothetical protein